jgi:hypothetical protein
VFKPLLDLVPSVTAASVAYSFILAASFHAGLYFPLGFHLITFIALEDYLCMAVFLWLLVFIGMLGAIFWMPLHPLADRYVDAATRGTAAFDSDATAIAARKHGRMRRVVIFSIAALFAICLALVLLKIVSPSQMLFFACLATPFSLVLIGLNGDHLRALKYAVAALLLLPISFVFGIGLIWGIGIDEIRYGTTRLHFSNGRQANVILVETLAHAVIVRDPSTRRFVVIQRDQITSIELCGARQPKDCR